jgi:8-oxo-dGTP pyrophosphatase MutT (NUDIX family)
VTDDPISDDTVLAAGDEPAVRLARWSGPVDETRADAAYLHALAGSSLVDPFATVVAAAGHLGVPVGSLVRHVLAEWASAGSRALLEAGPSVVTELVDAVRALDRAPDDASRDAALARLRGRAEWLAAGLEDADTTYPQGGAGARRRNRIGAYGLATGERGVLLARVADGYPGAGRWTLPGGGVDHGEHPHDALVREFHEETGLPAQRGAFLLTDSHHLVDDRRGDDLHLLRFVWRVTVPQDVEPAVQEVDGSTELARWVDLEELPSLRLLSVAALAIESGGLASPEPDRSGGFV